jgi:mRNA interferase MazF
MVIRQGDVFWADLNEPSGSRPGFQRPYVVVQNDAFNRSRIHTVVVCALTSNLKRALAPGNVLLERGEANLPKRSVVNVSQILTLDKTDLGNRIGKLPAPRVREVLIGIRLLIEPSDNEP